jgi:hypothetical protein
MTADTRPTSAGTRIAGGDARATAAEARATTEDAGTGIGDAGRDTGASGTPPSRAIAILRRELLILGIVLVFGFVLVPLAIWAVGNRILGPYTHLQDPTASAGPMRLLADFYSGLAHGSVVFWWVGLGPLVLVLLVRLLYGLIRPSRPSSAASTPRA